MKKKIVFDMDGLMFDTENIWLKCFKEAGMEMGYIFTDKFHDKTIGTNRNIMKKIFAEELGEDFPFKEFYDKYINLMTKSVKKEGVRPKKGLTELLEYLIRNDYDFAIASSSNKDKIIDYLECNNIDENIFKVIVSGEHFKNGKPEPDIFIRACELLEADSLDVIVLEDSNNGIKAAYRAGCIPILIPDINVITDETRKMADYEFVSLLDVIDFLEKGCFD